MARLPRATLHLPLVKHQPLQVVAFEVLRQPYSIESARLIVSGYTERLLAEVAPGTPVMLRWGKNRKHEVYGYVYETKPSIQQLQRVVEVVVVGAQHPMTWLKRIREFPPMAPHNVAAEIVDDYLLTLHASPEPISELPVQNDVSDWQYLTDLARSLGLVLLCTGSEIVLSSIGGYWRQSLRHQTYAATFRNALTHQANLRSFERVESPFFTLLDASSSPFRTDTNFVKFTDNKWSGSKALELFGYFFPTSANAVLLGPDPIYPLDAFDITYDVGRGSWAAIQIKYVLTMDDYYAEIVFGGDGQYYPGMARNQQDIASALQWRGQTMTRPPILKVIEPVRTTIPMLAHWESQVTTSPGTEEEQWLVGL